MNIFDPQVSGSLSVSGSGQISGDLTVLGTLYANISGTAENAVSASHAAAYTLTSSFHQFTSSYTTGAFTGSFNGDGSKLYNIPASGVTGLNLSQISQGNATASISQAGGFRVNTNAEFTGSVNITGSISLNGEPIGTGKLDETVFNSYTASNDSTNTAQNNRLSSLESTSGSINSYTSSNTTNINAIHTATSSLNNFTSSVLGAVEITGSNLTVKGDLIVKGTTTQIDSTTLNIGDNIIQLNGTGVNNAGLVVQDPSGASTVSGSLLWDSAFDHWKAGKLGSEERIILNDEYNTFSTSIDARATSIQSATSSLNSYTASNNTRLNIIESTTSSLNTFSSSTNDRLVSLESASSSIRVDLNNYTSSNNVRFDTIESTTGSLNLYTSSTNTRLSSIETSTGSLNSYTASNNTRLNIIESTTGSLNIFTSSQIAFNNDLNLTTSSLNSFTSSTNNRLSIIESATASLNLFTNSANNRINSLEVASASIRTDFNSYTSSTDIRLGAIESTTSSLNSYTSSANGRLNSLETSSGSIRNDFNTFTSSYTTVSGSLDSRLDVLEAYSSSQQVPTASYSIRTSQIDLYVKNQSGAQINKGRVVRITGATGDNPLISLADYSSESNSANTLGIAIENIPNDSFGMVITEGILLGVNTLGMTSGQLLFLGANGAFTTTEPVAPNHGVRLGEVLRVHQTQGSIYVRIDNGMELDEAHDVTYTNISQGDLLVRNGNGVWNNSKSLTGSYSLTGSLNISGSQNIIGNQTITGSLYVTQDLIIAGSSSIQHISSSVVNIADNIITVNAQNPGIRFGGLAVIDSGSSPQVSGSILFDSVNDQWLFVHQNQGAITSSVVLMGPESFNNLGGEIYLTQNRIPKGSGIEHLYDSNITDTGTKVSINSNTEITGTFVSTGTVYGTNIVAIETTTSSLNSYTASNDATNTNQNNRLSALETSTGSLNTYTSSNNIRLGTIEIATGSLNTFTSSTSTRLGAIESSTSSLNTFTSSTNSRLSLIETSTGSLNSHTSSTNTRLGAIETSTGSLNNYTSSNTTNINAIHTATSSLNSHTSSTNTRLSSIEVATGSLNSYTSSNTTNINAIHTATSSLNSFTSSANTRLNSLESTTNSLNSYTSSNNTNINAIHTATSSLNSFTSSANSRLSSIEASTSSLNSYTSSNNTNINAIHAATSSLNSFTSSINNAFSLSGADVTVRGNFTVSGTTTTVNSTTVNIADNIIQLNGSGATNAGLVVRDATSPSSASGSLLWDTANDKWIAGQLGAEDDIVLRTATQTLTNKTINASQLVDGSVTNAKLANPSFNIGTTSISLGRASASQTLTGVSIDGNAGTVTNGVYTTGDQTISGTKTFTGTISVTAGEGREITTFMPSSYTTNDLVSGHEYGWYDDHWRLGMTRSSAAAGADFVIQWNAARRLSLTNGGNLTVTGTISASNLSGTNTGDQTNITGNAGTATILQTARTIGGVSFNGSANIDLPGVNTTGNQNTTGTASNITAFTINQNVGSGNTPTFAGLTVGAGIATGRSAWGSFTNANIILTSSTSDSTGNCGIEFRSGNNFPSDGAAIFFENNGGGGSERAKLTIRVENDQEDFIELRGGNITLNANTISGGGQNPSIIFQNGGTTVSSISSTGVYNGSISGNAATSSRVVNGTSTLAGVTFGNTMLATQTATRVVNFDGNGGAPSVWWTNGSTAIGAIDAISGGGLSFWSNNGSSWQQQVSMTHGTFNVLTTLQQGGTQVVTNNGGTWGISITGNAATLGGISASGFWQAGGSWGADLTSNGYVRQIGVTYTGGEFVILTNNAQISTLIDGSYFAGEQGGFYSMNNSNQFSSRVGFNRDGNGNASFNSSVVPNSNGVLNLGTSSQRWNTIFTSDLSMSNGIGDYTIVEGEEDLFIYNNKTNKVFKFLLQEVDPSIVPPKKV